MYICKILIINILNFMSSKKFQQVTCREVVDTQTGEIIQQELVKTFTKKIESDKFYMTFVDYIAPYYNLKSDTAKSILSWMCAHAEYNTGIVNLTTNVRKQLTDDLKISPNTLTNNLGVLKKNNIISGEKGSFLLNPEIHWKGDMNTRAKLLASKEIQITFNIN